MIDRMEGSGVSVTRWRRYGKDRLYVEQWEGQKVGWWDLVTGEAHPESPGHLDALRYAVTAWQAENDHEPVAADAEGTTATAAVVDPPVEDLEDAHAALNAPPGADTLVERPWLDLATNHAGAAAREQALAARDAAPVKTVLARVLGVHTDERAWRIGADGEERVAAQLAKVAKKDGRWRFLHAIPVGERGSDIDHLVIGPGGVFTVNAKHHPRAKVWVGGNTVMINGNRVPYVRNSRHEAARAAKLLSEAVGFPVHVEGLIVTVNAADVVVKNQPDGVSVVPRMQVAKWLLRHGDIYSLEALDTVFEAARRSTTWQR
jgi:hypothetical protein